MGSLGNPVLPEGEDSLCIQTYTPTLSGSGIINQECYVLDEETGNYCQEITSTTIALGYRIIGQQCLIETDELFCKEKFINTIAQGKRLVGYNCFLK